MMNETFTVGQRVCMVTGDGVPIRLLTVTRAGKRKMVLSDTSEWTVHGSRPYGNSDKYYRGWRIRGVLPTDDEQIRTRNLARWLSKVTWDELPLRVLRGVHDLVKPAMAAKEPVKPEG